MSGEKDLATLIASMTPVLDKTDYVFGTLKSYDFTQLTELQPISTFKEKEGLTVIINKIQADEMKIAYSGVFNCITLNVHSSFDAVGLTAAVATKLTQANISANVIAAYYHDHVFIAVKDADKALAELNDLARLGI
ncbi:ACT domain-containing protein [Thalassotalea profundi]|uniref:Transporter n=1 Tax=Thalassotalea profundi TaxID=2036687 RepID=A0ABQ3J552_9GAMM|nr:ACT domain-containing protein [Thalassotalea profundi]GHF00909.1 transporter [Thalassotalea profundi]